MNFIRNFSDKESSTPLTKESTTKAASEQSYIFICSGNASVIQTYVSLFIQEAAVDLGNLMFLEAPLYFYADKYTLSVRADEARKLSLTFDGHKYMGSKTTQISYMDEVLQSLTRNLHIVYISVRQAGVSWVLNKYTEMLKLAMSQGILPYAMYVTKDKNAAQFLLGSFD